MRQLQAESLLRGQDFKVKTNGVSSCGTHIVAKFLCVCMKNELVFCGYLQIDFISIKNVYCIDMKATFDRSKHVFHSEAFAEIIKDTIRFFNGTPVHQLPPPENFVGAGVYAIYYIGKSPYYKHLYEVNRLNFVQPVYVGKAVPRGWRQARLQQASNELYSRLCEHNNSICQVCNLDIDDFRCRFMILENAAVDMIGTVEASLIRQYVPIWNSCIDGFGNHDPGSGRYDQAKSDWDILHPGRRWADNLKGNHPSLEEIKVKVLDYYDEKH